MDELISKQQAIDALKRKQDDGKGDLSRFYNTIIQHDIEAIMALPSAEPDCTDCIKSGGDWDCDRVHCHKGESAQPTLDARDTQYNLPIGTDVPDTNVGELISRQQAIDRLTEYGNGRAVFISVGEAVIRIEQLPPAHPKRGRWERGFDGNHAVCSNCQAWWIPFGEGYKTDYHFCPNCGAKMEAEE